MTASLFGEPAADAAPPVRRVRQPGRSPAAVVLDPDPATPPLFDPAALTEAEWLGIETAFELALTHAPAVAAKLRVPVGAVLGCWGELMSLIAPTHYAMPIGAGGSMAGRATAVGDCPTPRDSSRTPGPPAHD